MALVKVLVASRDLAEAARIRDAADFVLQHGNAEQREAARTLFECARVAITLIGVGGRREQWREEASFSHGDPRDRALAKIKSAIAQWKIDEDAGAASTGDGMDAFTALAAIAAALEEK